MTDLPEACDTDPETLAGEPVPDPWDLPDEPVEDLHAEFDGATDRGVTTPPEEA